MNTNIWAVSEFDLEEILQNTLEECYVLRNSQITILGGTGFIGTWITSFLLYASKSLNLNTEIIVPTRNPEFAKGKLKVNSQYQIRFIHLDLNNKVDVNYDESRFFIIGATPSNRFTGAMDDERVSAITRNAINSVINFSIKKGIVPDVLNLSSGAVYGVQKEEFQAERDVEIERLSLTNYGLAKLKAEMELRMSDSRNEIKCSNPRLFAFFGPHLPLDAHFAIGNFLNDCLKGNSIIVNGNPKTVRSYLYPTDLVTWIIKLLVKPTLQNLNFGSDIPITMEYLGGLLTKKFKSPAIKFTNPLSPSNIYVPEIQNTKRVLGVTQKVSLDQGIDRWVEWVKAQEKI